MIQVEQTVLLPPRGNCFAACIASILEVPLSSVPQIENDDEGDTQEGWEKYWARIHEELLHPMNLDLVDFGVGGYTPPGWSILTCDSPRGNWQHAVVAFDGEVVWDPHPQRAMGLGERKAWTSFLVRDPSKAAGKASKTNG